MVVRSLSMAKLCVSLLNRRSFTAAEASQSRVVSVALTKDGHCGGSRAEEDHMHGGKVEDRVHEESSETGILLSPPWIPDPVTGYYRPCHLNRVATTASNNGANE